MPHDHGSGMEVVARGVRNTVGFDWHPVTKELYFTDNGRDWLSEDIPEDELNRVTASGKKHFGFPFCHQGNVTDVEYGWCAWNRAAPRSCWTSATCAPTT